MKNRQPTPTRATAFGRGWIDPVIDHGRIQGPVPAQTTRYEDFVAHTLDDIARSLSLDYASLVRRGP